MKEKPILFSGPMVRAILEGRKWQTRRLVEPQPAHGADLPMGKDLTFASACPYGPLGRRLWVRETFVLELTGIEYEARRPSDRPFRENVDEHGDKDGTVTIPHYRATDPEPHIVEWDSMDDGDDRTRWKPSIFMPRWASRITLEVTGVRVERLQEISRQDANAEGLWPSPHNGLEMVNGRPYGNAQLAFRALWESINGEGSWAENPWVWVIEFQTWEVRG